VRFVVLAALVLALPSWVSFRSVRDHYQVTYPSSWHRASRSLTPFLSDPHEILTVGTGPLPVGGPRCAQAPVNALEAVGATGALVSIQERPGASGDNRGFPPRPNRFRLRPSPNLEIPDCLAPGGRPRLYWIAFRDRGRHFYALVALGHTATSQTRDDTLRILDSLRFSPTH
jgi:hypothetical protein